MAGSGTAQLRDRDDLVLRVEGLVVSFKVGGGRRLQAVSDVSLDVAKGETLGIVGESGCGKSTTAKAIIQLVRPSAGSVQLGDQELVGLKGEELRRTRRKLQMIFQDPVSSLNPRRTVYDVVSEGLVIWGSDRRAAFTSQLIDDVLTTVGLDPATARTRRPHEFSGGQCQRISIARAVALDPEVIICDEPVSALDVSVQAQILNLLEEMKKRYGLTLVFISHDLSVVKNVSDRVAVMYLGKLCEIGDSVSLYEQPAHPYTRALLASIPDPTSRLSSDEATLDGEIPSPLSPPSGCRFRTRCPRATDRCAAEEPVMEAIGDDHFVACHYPHR